MSRRSRHRAILGSRINVSDGASAAWTPTDLGASLVAWWDPDDSTTVSFSSGSNVSQLDDKSGNDIHLTKGSDPARPTLVSADQNGRDVLRFVYTSGEELDVSNVTAMDSLQDQSFFAVVANEHADGNGNGFAFRQRATIAVGLQYFDSTDIIRWSDGDTSQPDTGMALTGYHIIGVTRINGSPDQFKVYLNSTTASITESVTWSTAGAHQDFSLGHNGASGAHWSGKIGEMLVTNGDVESDVENIINYLNTRWSVF